MKLSIIIPAYNEEQSIASIIERTLSARHSIIERTSVSNIEIIVVNDGSSDQTKNIAQSHHDISLISYEENKGYGAAIKLGFDKATGDYLSFLDADGTCNPEFFSDLIINLEKADADIAIGSRLGPHSRMPKIRRLGNIIYAAIINFIGNVKITDSASGMRVIKREALEVIYPLPDGLHFTPAMSCKVLLNKKLKLIEIPMEYKERAGQSKLSVIKDGMRFFKIIGEFSLFYKPLKVHLTLGFVLISIGLLYSIQPILFYITNRYLEEWFIYRLLTILILFSVGFNFVIFGVFAERFVSALHNQKDSIDKLNNQFLSNILKPKNLLKIGLLMTLSGIVLNSKLIYQYITTGHIYEHWAYVLTGALFVLMGMQIFTFSLLHKIIDMYKENQSYREKQEKRGSVRF